MNQRDLKGLSDIPFRFFPGTAHSYDRVVRLFTLGLDGWWKRAMLGLLPPSSRVLDLACGTGIVSMKLSRKFPDAAIVGVDLTEDYLAIYRDRVQRGVFKADSILADAESVELEGTFDAVVSSYLPKYVHPEVLLSNLIPHLRPGATVIFHDFTLPPNRLARATWRSYTWCMNLLGRRLFPEWHEVFDDGLTDLITETSWFEDWQAAMELLGFVDVNARLLSFGSAGLVWGTWSNNAPSAQS